MAEEEEEQEEEEEEERPRKTNPRRGSSDQKENLTLSAYLRKEGERAAVSRCPVANRRRCPPLPPMLPLPLTPLLLQNLVLLLLLLPKMPSGG